MKATNYYVFVSVVYEFVINKKRVQFIQHHTHYEVIINSIVYASGTSIDVTTAEEALNIMEGLSDHVRSLLGFS